MFTVSLCSICSELSYLFGGSRRSLWFLLQVIIEKNACEQSFLLISYSTKCSRAIGCGLVKDVSRGVLFFVFFG